MLQFSRRKVFAIIQASIGQVQGRYHFSLLAGSGRVFVRGFDFGTTDEQLIAHMSTAGPMLRGLKGHHCPTRDLVSDAVRTLQQGEIETVHWVSKGSAIVVYKEAACALPRRADGSLGVLGFSEWRIPKS